MIKVERKLSTESESAFVEVAELHDNSTTFLDSNVTPATGYDYRVFRVLNGVVTIASIASATATAVLEEIVKTLKYTIPVPLNQAAPDRIYNVSAGIYVANGGPMVRTLLSNEQLKGGDYHGEWDGMLNDKTMLPDGEYKVGYSHNYITPVWEGSEGHKSQGNTLGDEVRSFQWLYDIVRFGDYLYTPSGYSEGSASNFRFHKDNLGKISWLRVGDNTTPHMHSYFVAANQSLVFQAGGDTLSPFRSGICAYNPATGINHVWATEWAGIMDMKLGNDDSAIAIKTTNANWITGLCVQPTGDYIFVSRGGATILDSGIVGTLEVYKWATGEPVGSYPMSWVSRTAIDAAGKLWVATSVAEVYSVKQYNIDAAGVLTPTGVEINGLEKVMGLTCSPFANTLVIGIGGSFSNYQFYNSVTGAHIQAFGAHGGYNNNAWAGEWLNGIVDGTWVPYLKFGFEKRYQAFCRFDTDGSLWLSDSANFTVKHYSADLVEIEELMFVPKTYSSRTDPVNPRRNFLDFMELDIDRRKPLVPMNTNRRWFKKANWMAQMDAEDDTQFFRFFNLTTFSNGRTYTCSPRVDSNSNYALLELTPEGILRTTTTLIYANSEIKADGLWTQSTTTEGQPVSWTFQPWSYDANHNPIAGAVQHICSIPSYSPHLPIPKGGLRQRCVGEFTTGGYLLQYEGGRGEANQGYHFGAVKQGATDFAWVAGFGTKRWHQGPLSWGDAYEMGNGTLNKGSQGKACGPLMMFAQTLEFYKGAQANIIKVFHETGQHLCTAGADTSGKPKGLPFAAGNAFRLSFFQDWGKYYVTHNDEGQHSGMHSIRFDNMDSVVFGEATLTLATTATGLRAAYSKGTDLNNASIALQEVTSTIGGNWTEAPIATSTGFSVKYIGHIKAAAGAHPLTLNTNRGVRMFYNDQLVIDQWDNTTQQAFSYVATFEAGKKHPIEIEFKTPNTGNLSFSSSAAVELYPGAEIDTTDLLYGLKYGTTVRSLYGMVITPELQEETSGSSTWLVRTSVNENSRIHPGLSVNFSYKVIKNNSFKKIFKTDSAALNYWKMKGIVNIGLGRGNDYAQPTRGRQWLDIRDNTGLPICRVYAEQRYTNPHYWYLYLNNTLVASDNTGVIDKLFHERQAYEVTYNAGVVTFTFGPYTVTGKKDAAADATRPETLFLDYYGSDASNSSYAKGCSIEKMKFTTQI